MLGEHVLGESVLGEHVLGDYVTVPYPLKYHLYISQFSDSNCIIFTYLVKSSASAIVDEYEGLDA